MIRIFASAALAWSATTPALAQSDGGAGEAAAAALGRLDRDRHSMNKTIMLRADAKKAVEAIVKALD